MDPAKLTDQEWKEAIARIRAVATPLVGREVTVRWHATEMTHNPFAPRKTVYMWLRRWAWTRDLGLFWWRHTTGGRDVFPEVTGVLTAVQENAKLAELLAEDPAIWVSVEVDGRFATFIDPGTTIEETK